MSFRYLPILGIAIAIGFGISFAVKRQAQTSASPSIAAALIFEPASMQLGEVEWGAAVKHSLVLSLSSQNKEPVVISRVESSCGCTVIQEELVGRTLWPGESVELGFRFDAGNYAGDKSSQNLRFCQRWVGCNCVGSGDGSRQLGARC